MAAHHFTLTFFDLIVSLGIAQAVVMALILWLSPVTDKAKQLLAVILLVLALLNFKILLHTLGLWQLPAFRYFPLAIDTLPGPLFYFYICTMSGQPLGVKKVLLYLFPVIAFMLHALLVYSLALSRPTLMLKDSVANSLLFDTVKNAEDAAAVIMATIFWVMGYRRLAQYRQWLYGSQSDSRLHELTWLRNLLMVTMALIGFLAAVVIADDMLHLHGFVHLQIFYSYLVVVIYYLSFKGYTLHSLSRPTIAASIPLQPETAISVSGPDTEAIKQSIVQAFEKNRIYLNPELNIKDLAQHTGYPAAAVSATINQSFEQNFRALVNHYRVAEVKRLLMDPPTHLSLLGIALEAGFNSEASFYRIFRQETGLSPKEYIKQQKNL